VVDLYGFTQIAEAGAENMDLILPSGESILNPDCIAILKGAPHPVAAQKFVEFVLSESGQCLWLAPLGHPRGSRKFAIERMAIRPKLYEDMAGMTLVKTNPFREFHPLHYNARVGMRRWGPLNALLGALVIDRSPNQRQNVRVPVSEEELNQLADKEWKDPVQRTRLLLAWQKTR
jgi:spermidine/putrescine-binding protein